MFNLLVYDFMQRAFLAVIAMSLFSPVLGTFLILRRQSLMSDTLSHVSLSGVAFGLVLGISPTISTVIIVMIAAVFLEYLRTIYKDFMEIGTAILMSTGLAIALIVMSRGKSSSSMSLDQYLFGSIVTISTEQVISLFIIAAIVLTLLPELLRGLNDYRMLIYAIVLIVMMLFNWSPKAIEWREKYSFRRKTASNKQAEEV